MLGPGASCARQGLLAGAALVAALALPAPAAAVDLSGQKLPRNVKVRALEVDGIKTRLLVAVPKEQRRAREAVVFLHGFPGSSLDYTRLVSRTGRFARAVAFDFPGFGRADKPADLPYTVDSQAAFAHAALRRLGIRRVHLVGHDYGSFNGLEWASAHPQRLRSVTLIDGGILPDEYVGHGFAYASAIPGVGEAFNEARSYETFRAGLSPPVHPQLEESFIARMYEEYDDPGSRRATPRLYRSFGNYRERSDRWTAALLPYDLPARVLWGEADPFVPAWIAEYQRQAFPRADVRVLPDIGHFPFAEAPRDARRFIMPFLRKQLR